MSNSDSSTPSSSTGRGDGTYDDRRAIGGTMAAAVCGQTTNRSENVHSEPFDYDTVETTPITAGGTSAMLE